MKAGDSLKCVESAERIVSTPFVCDTGGGLTKPLFLLLVGEWRNSERLSSTPGLAKLFISWLWYALDVF